MFQIFTKKIFLVDCLQGFVDIHNHILPGIDDGAQNVEESISLIKGFGEFGVTDFICTPHIMENYYPNNSTTINNARVLLNENLKRLRIKNVQIRVAAEHMIDSDFERILEEGAVMPMQGNYLLIEMSYLQASINFKEAQKKIAENGYFGILAHPERYIYMHTNFQKYLKLKANGILFQLNLLSLGKYYGKEVQKIAFMLLTEGLIDFVGSDVHNHRQLEELKGIVINRAVREKIDLIINKTTSDFS